MYQINDNEDRWLEIQKIWRQNQWLYVFIGIAIGFLLSALWTIDIRKFVEGLAPEAFGIFFTILVIDRLAQNREQRQLFRQLTWQLKNHDNGLATHAVGLMREYGWLSDGSLRGMALYRSNLENTWLGDANLQECDFSSVNLKNAYLGRSNLYKSVGLTDDKLSKVNALQGAIMPDGTLYDGRYNLPSDLRNLKRHDISSLDDDAIARFYGVSLEKYLAGQQKFTRQNRNSEIL